MRVDPYAIGIILYRLDYLVQHRFSKESIEHLNLEPVTLHWPGEPDMTGYWIFVGSKSVQAIPFDNGCIWSILDNKLHSFFSASGEYPAEKQRLIDLLLLEEIPRE